MKISHDLKMKIISNYKSVNIEQHYNEIDVLGRTTKIPLYREISLSFILNDLNLIKECVKWMDIGMDVSVVKMVVDIGPFVGLFPTEVNMNNNTVTFTADVYNPNRCDWKDWFVMEEEYAP